MSRISGRLQKRVHRLHDSRPGLLLRGELAFAITRQDVRPDAASFHRFLPLPLDPALLFETMKRRKEGPRLYLESSLCDLRDSFGDGGAIHRVQIQRTQDEKIERAFQEFDSGSRHVL